jgi:hypothetical protein
MKCLSACNRGRTPCDIACTWSCPVLEKRTERMKELWDHYGDDKVSFLAAIRQNYAEVH